jgi:ribosomal protein S27E
MNSIRDIGKIDPVLASLFAEIKAKRQEEAAPVTAPRAAEPLPKRIFEGPHYDGKQCAVCQRKFKSASEYVTCKLCGKVVCRRKGTCKSLHRGQHRIAFLKATTAKEPHGTL